MRGKLMFLGGIAIGYVLGARAGRERYEQLASTARQWWDHPTVQEAAGVVQAQANRIYAEGKDVVSDKLGNSKFADRMGQHERLGKESPHGDKLAEATELDPLAGTAQRPQGSTF